jgi:hypothetical protein
MKYINCDSCKNKRICKYYQKVRACIHNTTRDSELPEYMRIEVSCKKYRISIIRILISIKEDIRNIRRCNK